MIASHSLRLIFRDLLDLSSHVRMIRFLLVAFYGTDVALIMKALSVLERSGKVSISSLLLSTVHLSQMVALIIFSLLQCHVLKGDTSESDGVKFLAA